MVPKDPVFLKVFIGDTWCSQDAKTFINTAKVPEKGPIWVPKIFFFNSKLLISKKVPQIKTRPKIPQRNSSSGNTPRVHEFLKRVLKWKHAQHSRVPKRTRPSQRDRSWTVSDCETLSLKWQQTENPRDSYKGFSENVPRRFLKWKHI